MQATHIREGIFYAVSTKPRKGIKPEALHRVESIRCAKVLDKGRERYAQFAKDTWGDPDGEFKNDGIAVTYNAEDPDAKVAILKPRDVLMPWNVYEQRVEQDAVEAAARTAEATRIEAEQEALIESLRERLNALGLTEYVSWNQTNDYEISSFQRVRMNVPSMHRLLDSISTQVYELLSSAE